MTTAAAHALRPIRRRARRRRTLGRNTRGLPQRMWDSLYGLSRFDHHYAYDAAGNLTQLTDGVDYSENRFMAYDARDRLTEASAPYLYGEEIFDYDALDNVRRAAIYPLGGGSYLLDYRFVYDANQRLDRINDAIGTLLWDYSHNALGETTWRAGAGNTWSYAWSAVGRMTQGGNESYVYDAHGHRSRATRSGTGSTRYQVHNRSGKLLYVEDSRDDQRIDYLHLGSKLIAQRSRPLYGSTATVTYHHTDHLGSASVETNASGTQTQRTLRTPYGSPYDGTYREGPGFAGHVTDTATNLTYMQQRYYDPVAMRFISTDPVDVSAANGGNFNRYWYGNNNPYRFTDPDGRYSCSGNAGDCKKIDSFVNKINDSLKGMEKGSRDYTKISAISKLLGTNDGKGVTLKIGALEQNRVGEPSGLMEITIDTKQTDSILAPDIRARNGGMSISESRVVAGATTLVHESGHLIDINRVDYDGKIVGFPRSKEATLSTERRAYGAEGAFGRGLGVDTGYSTPADVEAGAQRSTASWCVTNGGC